MKPILLSILALALTVFSASFVIPVDTDMAVMSVAVSWFVFGKITLCLFLMQGHGVLRRKGFYGISVVALVLFAVIGAGIVVITNLVWKFPVADEASLQVALNLRLFSVAAATGYLASFVLWTVWLQNQTFYGSEYDARLEFKAAGYSDEEISRKIERLRARGVFGKPD